MIQTQNTHGPLLTFHDFVRKKAKIFNTQLDVNALKRLPVVLELKFFLLRYCDLIDRFRGLSVYIPHGGTPTGYRFAGFGIMELLMILNTFDDTTALTTLNEMWQFTPGMMQYPTRAGHTYYPMSIEGFKDEFKSLSSMKFSQQQEQCAKHGGRIISVEEFLDYLIDCSLRFRLPLKKLIRSMIPQISSIGITDYIMIRCANSVSTARRLHIILNRRGEIYIMERPSEMPAPDISTMCSYRMPS